MRILEIDNKPFHRLLFEQVRPGGGIQQAELPFLRARVDYPLDRDGLPYFASEAAGDAILENARMCPDREITILCGHTHSASEARVAPNVFAIAGAAAYGCPTVQRVFELPTGL